VAFQGSVQKLVQDDQISEAKIWCTRKCTEGKNLLILVGINNDYEQWNQKKWWRKPPWSI